MDVPNITMDKFGKDHWSTFVYIENRCVDHHGVPKLENMKCNPSRHPGMSGSTDRWKDSYSTKLNDGSQVSGHDDWDCVEDLEREGLIEWLGTGINPVFSLTDKGWEVVGKLRRHIATARNMSKFNPGE